MSNAPARSTYRFSVVQYYKMGEIGIFRKNDPVELLNGCVVLKPPFSIRHIHASRRLNNVMFSHYGNRSLIDVRSPLLIDDFSLPQPDLALLQSNVEQRNSPPIPEDVLLLIEVADLSLAYDLTDKRDAYARCGIAEYWLLDLTQDQMHVFRDPREDGYGSETMIAADQSIAPLAFPEDPLALSEILPHESISQNNFLFGRGIPT